MAGRKPIPVSERFDEKVASAENGCRLWTARSKTHNGYGVFSLGRGKQKLAHRYQWERHFGEVPQDKEVCHRCDVRSCVNPAHLFLGTRQDNVTDCVLKGRHQHGSRHYSVKLTQPVIAQLKQLAGTASQLNLAVRFGISQQTVSRILIGKHWSNSQ